MVQKRGGWCPLPDPMLLRKGPLRDCDCGPAWSPGRAGGAGDQGDLSQCAEGIPVGRGLRLACHQVALRSRIMSRRVGWGGTSSVSGGDPLLLVDSRKCFAFFGLCKFLSGLVERAS